MADSNQTRRDDFAGFSDDDPFAELTRIMGHDPRAPQAPTDREPAHQPAAAAQAAFEDDFDIDLEQELMGELDFSEFEEQPETPVAEPETFASAADHRPDDDAFGQASAPTHARYDEIYHEGQAEEAAPVSVNEAQPHFEAREAEPEVAFDDEFGDALERELMGDAFDAGHDDEEVAPAPAFVAEPQQSFEQPQADAFDRESDASWEREPQQDDASAWQVDAATYEQPHFPQATAEEPVAELTLEDELHALLADDPSPVQAAVSPEPVESWQPATSTIGRANYPAVRTFEPAALEPFVAQHPVQAEDDRLDELRRHEDEQTAQSDFEDLALADDDFDEIFGSDLDFQVEAHEQTPPVEYAEPEAEAPAFTAAPVADVSGLDALAAWEPERERVAQPALHAGGYQAPVAASATSREAPEIETVDLQEAPVAMTDDLDIPDVAYETAAPASGPYDDLEGEIAEAFGDLSLDEPEPAATASQADSSMEWAGMAAAAGGAASGAAYSMARGPEGGQQAAGAGYGFGQASWDASPAAQTQDDFDYEADLDEAIAMAAYGEDTPVASSRWRRAPMIAAIVAGVAVIGGTGLFAMSLFGGASDTPAVVLADTDPMKVKPENPGGVTVPNQDSQVYQRVATGEPEPAPEQTRLITTAEEPVDVTAQGNSQATLPPGVSDPLADAGDDTVAAFEKSEERLQPASETEASGLAEEVAVVAPRRVRTMVVRPDGTMVPREETAPVTTASQDGDTVIAAAPLGGATTLQAPGAPAATLPGLETAAGEEDGGPLVNTPDTVSVVPSQRTEPSTTVAAAPIVNQQPEIAQRPAATPVSAPAAPAPTAAASSEWSMQIASQPSAEGAQSTYQDLARRYGDVLAGRGVNIVRADIQGKGTYYRVRIPAPNRDEAIQLCTRYKSAGGSCFVSR